MTSKIDPFVRGASGRNSRNRMDTSAPPRGKHSNYVNVVVGRGDTSGVMAKSYPNDKTPLNQNNGGPHSSHEKAATHPMGSDAHYTQQLRRGFIDLRASYSEKRKPRNPYMRGGAHALTGAPRRDALNEGQSSIRHRDIRPYTHRGLRNEGKGLYRSNSSLEIDYIDDDDGAQALRRDYGSTSSLDMIASQNNNNGESFFQLLKDYRHDNVDQRAPAPPKVQDILKPRSPTEQAQIKAMAQSTSNSIVRLTQKLENVPQHPVVSNGSVPAAAAADEQTDGSQGSPRLKSKSQKKSDRKSRNKSMVNESTAGGIFKKLRGGVKSELIADSAAEKSDSAPADDYEHNQEERLRRKAFLFYDVQAVCVSLLDVVRRRRQELASGEPLRNVKTGASAASSLGRSLSREPDTDPGDGKSNELVQHCPFFRNEVGGEEERCVALCRSNAMKRTQRLLGANNVDSGSLQKHPVCNGIAVLDCSCNAAGQSVPTIQSHRGLVVEYFDHGALYYRYYFHQQGEINQDTGYGYWRRI